MKPAALKGTLCSMDLTYIFTILTAFSSDAIVFYVGRIIIKSQEILRNLTHE